MTAPTDTTTGTRLTFVDGNHTYWLADSTGKRRRVPSVSALVKTLHPFDNDRWKMGQAADAVTARWDELLDLPPTMRRDTITGIALDHLAVPREFGSAVHHYCEQLWGGEPVPVPDLYAGHVAAVAEWWRGEHVQLRAAEAMVWADDDGFGAGPYAGRFDLLIQHPRWGLGLLDLKTWGAQSTGSPRTEAWAMQLAAYAGADHIVIGDRDRPMPQVDWLGVLHVGPGGADLWRVTADGWQAAWAQVIEARVLKTLTRPTMERAQ